MTRKVSSSQYVYVQAIETTWHKSERGGLGAAQRNRVPDAIKLPAFTSALQSPAQIFLHKTFYSASNKFVAPVKETTKVVTFEPRHFNGLSLNWNNNVLSVFYEWHESQGAPPRYVGRPESLHLSPEQWGRVCWNGRMVDFDGGTWWYEKWVYNIGLSAKFSPLMFKKTEPIKVASYMAELW